jgi:hypothetical protein
LVGFCASGGVLVQVKSRDWPSALELATLRAFPYPPGFRRIVHRWRDRARTPAGIARLHGSIRQDRLAAVGKPTGVVDSQLAANQASLAALEAVQQQLVLRTKSRAVRGVRGTAVGTTVRKPLRGNADLPPSEREGNGSEARCRPPT